MPSATRHNNIQTNSPHACGDTDLVLWSSLVSLPPESILRTEGRCSNTLNAHLLTLKVQPLLAPKQTRHIPNTPCMLIVHYYATCTTHWGGFKGQWHLFNLFQSHESCGPNTPCRVSCVSHFFLIFPTFELRVSLSLSPCFAPPPGISPIKAPSRGGSSPSPRCLSCRSQCFFSIAASLRRLRMLVTRTSGDEPGNPSKGHVKGKTIDLRQHVCQDR